MRMILPYLFLLSVLLCCSLAAYTQDKSLDSLQKILLTQKEDTNAVNTRNAITKYFMNEHDYKNALKYGENALLLAKKINFKRGTGTAYEYLGWYYDEQNNKSAALENYLASLKIREEIADKAGIAKSQYWIGFAYSSLENFPESLKYWYLALKGYEALGDKIVTATILQLIGGTYSDEGNYPEALKNFIESEKIKEEMGDSLGAAQTYNSIGTIYCNQKKHSEALQQHTTALEIYKINGKLSPDWGIPWSHSCIGRVYYMQGEAAYELENWSIAESKFIKAYEIYLDALKEWQVINRQDGVASVYVTLGELSVELSYQKKPSEKISRLSEARKYYQKALNLSTAIGSKMYIRTSHFGLSNLELTLGNYKEALEHYKIYIEYRDSMLNQENEKKAIDAKTQYEVSKKKTR